MKLNINRRIKNGMWVRVKVNGLETGILQDVNFMTGTGDVHLVNMEDGTTRMVIPAIPLASMEQARLKDIPSCRHGILKDQLVAKRLGYL